MKKRGNKKLTLAKETLALLQDDELREPHGGSMWTNCSFCCLTSNGEWLCEHAC